MRLALAWLGVMVLVGPAHGRSGRKTLVLDEVPDGISRSPSQGNNSKSVPVPHAPNATITQATTVATAAANGNATTSSANSTTATALNGTTAKPANGSEATSINATTREHDLEVHKEPRIRHFFSSLYVWKDSYAFSIVVPIMCGVTAALLIICSLWCIGCCKRRCRSRYRRKLGKQLDSKSIRKLKAADRIKLLAASSDEEF